MHNLGSLGYCYSGDYDFCSSAAAINDHGDIVGSAAYGSDQTHAVLWKGSTLHDLNDLIPSGAAWAYLADAADINEQGCITGAGFVMNGSELRRVAYLLVPVVLKKLTTSPMMARGGSTLTGTVHLNGEAPFALDIAVHLEGLDGAAELTSDTVTVPQGASSAGFDIETFSVETRRTGSVIASFGGTTVSKTLTINPARFFPGG
jgi:probable HAF family extracellular repeat protein